MFPTLAIRFAVVLTFVTSALVLPPTRHTLERLDISHSLLTLVYLSPQAMAVAFPIAAFVAVVMHGIATRASAPALMRGILPFVLGLSLASLVLTFWVMPASNQAFRMLVYNASRPATEAFRDLPRGMNERSWTELTELSATGTVLQSAQARTALRIKYAIAIVTCLSGLIAVPLAIFIRPRELTDCSDVRLDKSPWTVFAPSGLRRDSLRTRSSSEGWRRGRDSNPWYPSGYSGFQDRRHRPLGHPSTSDACLFPEHAPYRPLYVEVRGPCLSCLTNLGIRIVRGHLSYNVDDGRTEQPC